MEKELLHGTLEVMVLKALSWGPMHGYGVGRWLERRGGDRVRVEEGSLYPALYRLERKGWVESEWGLTEKNRRAKYYHLTDEGRRQLRDATALWSDFAASVARVLAAETL